MTGFPEVKNTGNSENKTGLQTAEKSCVWEDVSDLF